MKEISKINIAGDERTIGAEGEITKINVNGKEYTLAGSGTKVVTELPEVGEEHTVYELRENKPASYDWVAMFTAQMGADGVAFDYDHILIFDTYEQMTSTINNLNTENISAQEFAAYLRNEDKLYGANLQEGSGSPTWQYIEVSKISAYNFAIRENSLHILTSYEGYDEVDDCYKGTLPNGATVNLYQGSDLAFILHQATYDAMASFISTGFTVHPVTTLPTAQELVANYLDDLVVGGGSLEVEINGVVKYNEHRGRNYRWVQELENFYQHWEEDAEPSEIYTGELEWNSYGDPTFDTIPYQEFFEMSEEAIWYFHPWTGGDKVSYWIYSNDEWVNMDDVGKPVNGGTIYLASDSYGDLKQIEFYLDGQELEVEWFDILHYGILKGIPTNEMVTINLSDWALGIYYNNIDVQANPENAIEVTGAGCLSFNFIQS